MNGCRTLAAAAGPDHVAGFPGPIAASTGILGCHLLRYRVPCLGALMVAWLFIAFVPELSTILLVNKGAGVYQLQ